LKQNLLLIVIAIFVVSLIITLNIFLQENYKAEIAEQFNKQQLLLTDTVSKNIKTTMEHLGDEIASLGRVLGVRGTSAPGLKDFVDSAFEEVIQNKKLNLYIFDAQGKVLYADGTPGALDRQMAAETKGLKGGLKGPQSYITKQLVDERMIKYYAPLLSNDKRWIGAVGVDLHLDSINEKFLAPIRSGKRGYGWMMTDDGTLLFHPTQPGMIGKNLHRISDECYKCHKSFDTERWILTSSGQSGASSYMAPQGEDKLIAFSKVDIFGKKWIICVSIPFSEVTMSIRKSQKLHSILILTIFGATLGGAVLLLFLNRKRVLAEQKAKHEEELERYAAGLERTVDARTRELFTEKEKLKSIVNAIGGGLFLMAPGGEILWANKQFDDMTGISTVGKNCAEVCPECADINMNNSESPDRKESLIDTRVLQGLFQKKGKYFQVTSAPVALADGSTGYIRLVQDVTEMKRLEEQMLHSEKLASIGRLTAGIAHEIGNPLTAVFSFLQILRDMETEDFKKESLATIMFHMRRIADTVRQLSSLSKAAPQELRPVKINSVLRNALDLMKYDKRSKGIAVVEDFEDVPEIISDENQASQIFINLILNAVDAMPDGGKLTVRSWAAPENVVVEVLDTGVGIAKENLARIFDPFFTTKEKGTGLGLSLTYGLVKRLGGEILVDSEEGKGTKFTVSLPLERESWK
jgi:signal transduction histidine kinase